MGAALAELVGGVAGTILTGAGIVILDEEGNIHLKYREFESLDEARSFGLETQAEMDAFNNHVHDFNAIHADIHAAEGDDFEQMLKERYGLFGVPHTAQRALAKYNRHMLSEQ